MTDREKQIEEIYDIIGEFDEGNEYSMATAIYDAGYRKLGEATLKLDLGDRSAEEIKQIAEVFNGEIKKQVAKEILQELENRYWEDIDMNSDIGGSEHNQTIRSLKKWVLRKYSVEQEE